MDLKEPGESIAKSWYDGYTLFVNGKRPLLPVYNPKSVVEAMLRQNFGTYWNQTETYEALLFYLKLNFDGLKDAVVSMLAGGSVPINTSKFQNDMTEFSSKDDVLTLLIHLGYLSYNSRTAFLLQGSIMIRKQKSMNAKLRDWVHAKAKNRRLPRI